MLSLHRLGYIGIPSIGLTPFLAKFSQKNCQLLTAVGSKYHGILWAF
jgi:hypothetical protein